MKPGRRLIEEWLPIAEIGIESDRERVASSALPPIYYLHTWWARRPLVVSRAAVLASILPVGADRKKFTHVLGILGDPIKARQDIDRANQEKRKLGPNPYGYKRAFTYIPNGDDHAWLREVVGQDLDTVLVLDPTAGGGSIPLESQRLGCATVANDLNPVASLLLQATTNWPSTFGEKLVDEFQTLCTRFLVNVEPKYTSVFPALPKDITINGYLWARTIPCPHCSGLIPLSPNWRLASDGTGVRLQPHKSRGPGSEGRVCSFKIVESVREQSEGTVSGGDATCPYPDCRRVIAGDEIKAVIKSGNMDEQLYAVAYKKRVLYLTKARKRREKWIKEYRIPKPTDDNGEFIQSRLDEKLAEWDVHDVIPDERIPHGSKTKEAIRFGANYWRDLFSPRQLLCHGTSIEVFRELFDEDKSNGNLTGIRKAAYGCLAIALDTTIAYNNRLTLWDGTTDRGIRYNFARHDYGFSWSYAEMVPLVAGLGYEWAFDKTVDSVQGLIDLMGTAPHPTLDQSGAVNRHEPRITCKSGDDLYHMGDGTVDAVVMDPPYYDNVMYAELSDFFYVWLKRTAGLVFPDLFQRSLTDKEREAVANPAKFAEQRGAGALAKQDYQDRMELIFQECRRVLKPSGIMTVMFMHKSTGAWDALTKSIIEAGFYITSSWPVTTEASGSMHIREKAAAKSTILLACRPRQTGYDISYWEDVEPKVRTAVRSRIGEFEKVGMRGADAYLSAFGPALEEFSRNWPMQRSTPRNDGGREDQYSVTPEDALEAARREVKKWRLDRLICSTPNKDLDPATAFFVLAWDAFKSPKFQYDEALHLARAVDVDLERDVVGTFAKKDKDYLILWDSQKRHSNGRLEPRSGSRRMIDALHRAAHLGRSSGADAAIKYIESERLDRDDSFIAALEAVLEVLPPSYQHTRIELKGDAASASSDFDALFDVYRLKFSERIDSPAQLELFM